MVGHAQQRWHLQAGSCFWLPCLCPGCVTSGREENTKMVSPRSPWPLPWLLKGALFSGSPCSKCWHWEDFTSVPCIFDDTFQTVHSLPSDKPIHAQWEEILKFKRECFAEMDYDKIGEPILPLLSDIIKTFRKEREQRHLQDTLTPSLPVTIFSSVGLWALKY
jgi:hypothetical protein